MANVLLVGIGQTALSALESLKVRFNVLGIVRDTHSEANAVDPVVVRARELGISIFSDTSPEAIEALVSNLKPDCVVVSSYKHIFSSDLIAKCPFVNVHYSPLPRYRGQAQVNWALINDEPCAAITIHTMVPELDAGNILFQRLVPIRDHDTVADVLEKLNELQREHLADTIDRFLKGYEGVPQNPKEATFGCPRVPADGEIDWAASTRQIYCLVRALVPPYPGAYTFFQGRRLVIWEAEPVDNPPRYEGRIPGRVIGISKTEGYVDVLTGDGILRVLKVQFEGEDRIAAANVIRSIRATLGLRTVELLDRIQALEQKVAQFMEARSRSP